MTIAVITDDFEQTDWDIVPAPDFVPIRGADIKIDRVGLAALRELKSNPEMLTEEREAIHERLEARNEFRLAQSKEIQDQSVFEGRDVVQVRTHIGELPPGWNGPINKCAPCSGEVTIAALSIFAGLVCACFPLTAPAAPWLLTNGVVILSHQVLSDSARVIEEIRK